VVEVKSVTKAFGKERVLNQVKLTLPNDAVVSIVGPNGSGKSTLMSIITGRLRPDSGSVMVDGQDIALHPSVARRIGYVMQQDTLFASLTVADNIRFWASVAGLSYKEAIQNVGVELLGLQSFLSKRVSALSGGMRRRTAICIALLSQPDVLILDEPFTGLDFVYQEELITYLGQLKQLGKSILFTSHNAGQIQELSDQVYAIHDGKLTFAFDRDRLVSLRQRDIKDELMKFVMGVEEV